MALRGMDLTDLPACAALYARLANRPPINDRWTPASAQAFLADAYGRGVLTSYVADDEAGALLGFVLATLHPWWSGPALRVEALMVADGAQGQGIGGRLLDHLLAEAGSRHGAASVAVLLAERQAAVPLFEVRGFSQRRWHLYSRTV